MKNLLKVIATFVAALVLAAVFASCGDISTSEENENSGVKAENGKALVSFNLGELGRTIMPTNVTESDITKIELTAEKLGSDGTTYADYNLPASVWLSCNQTDDDNSVTTYWDFRNQPEGLESKVKTDDSYTATLSPVSGNGATLSVNGSLMWQKNDDILFLHDTKINYDSSASDFSRYMTLTLTSAASFGIVYKGGGSAEKERFITIFDADGKSIKGETNLAASDGKKKITIESLEPGEYKIVPNGTEVFAVLVGEKSDLIRLDEVLCATTPWTGEPYNADTTALDLVRNTKLLLDIGTYNFTLNLYTGSESEYRLVQSGSLTGETVSSGSNTLAFSVGYVETGDLNITLTWAAGSDEKSRIGKIESELYKIAENGVIGEKLTTSSIMTTAPVLTSDDDGNKIFTTVSTAQSVANGSYYIKFKIYDSDEETVLNTITEIVKIHGYKTEDEIILNLDKINILYNITYNLGADDASWADGVEEKLVKRRNAYTGITLPTSEDVTRNGYNFAGWQPEDSSSVIEKIGVGSTTAKDYVLTAQWIEHGAHALKYMNVDGIEEEITNPQQFKETEEVTLETVSKTGYTFGGWYTDEACTDGNEISSWGAGDKTDDVTVWAKWIPHTYTIKLEPNYEGGESEPLEATYDEEVELKNNFTRTGYTFVGWAEEEAGESVYGDEEIVKNLSADDGAQITLYAIWSVNEHNITYNNVEGLEPDTFTEIEGFELPTVSKTYYTFDGWYTDEDCTEGNEISSWEAGDKTDDVEVYAKWTLVPNLYVSSSGSDKNDGSAQDKALDSITNAVSTITSLAEEDADWTIYVSGEVKGAQTVSSSLTAEVAKRLTIAGLSKNTIDDSEYTDILNGNFGENNMGTTLTIETELPITITNLQITGGYYPVIESDNNYTQGGGIKIATDSTKVTLDNTLISGNKSDCGAAIELNGGTLVMKDSVVKDNEAISELGSGTGGIVQIDPETKFFMYGSSVIGDKNAKEHATETSYSNKGDNPGIYNSQGFVYLGYSGLDASGEPVKAEFTGGIYGNYGCTAAIFNDSGTLYMNSGTIKYNTVADEESQVTYTGEGSTFVMMGGSIESNSGTVDVAGSWDSVVSPFTLDGEVGIDTELRCRAKGVVTIGSNFKTKNPIPLSVETYEEGLEVLAPATGVTLTSDIIANFSLVQPDDGVTWVITTDGKLKKLVADSTFQITLESVKSDDTGIVSLGVDGSSVEATIAAGYSVYSWTVDGADFDLTQLGDTPESLNLAEATLSPGIHNIMLTVVNDNDETDYYSATVVFKVTKE